LEDDRLSTRRIERAFLAAGLGVVASLCSPSPSRSLATLAGMQPAQLPDLSEGRILDPPFAQWGPATDDVFRTENRSSTYSAEIHYDLGLYFFEQGQYELSLSHYQKAAEIDPGFAEAYFGIGLLFYSLGDDENAIRYYERSLECNPTDADTQNNLGLIYYRRGDLVRAQKHIEEAIRLQPSFPDAFYNLGLVHYQRNELEVAIANFRAAIEQDPMYFRARFNLGVVYFELGRTDLAEAEWGKVIESAPGTALAEQAQQNLAILREASH
jgi:tetratricopeptide (TPR) repeat protein